MRAKAKKKLYRAARAAVLTSFLLTACAAMMVKPDQPSYNVVVKSDAGELRQYPTLVVAETTVPAPEDTALTRGFDILSDYIDGANAKKEHLPMTAPVLRQSAGRDGMIVRFIMPEGRTLESLPRPLDERVKLRTIKGAKVAALQFPGLTTETVIKRKTRELQIFVTTYNLVTQGPPLFARYDPPWTLPMLRRNEVMMVVK